MHNPFRLVYLLFFLVALPFPAGYSQTRTLPDSPIEPLYSFRRSWSLFSEYSPDSSHIFLGITHEREFFTLGGAFTQRLFLKRNAALSYMAEVRPIMLESDPVAVGLRFTLSGPDIYFSELDRLPQRTPVID